MPIKFVGAILIVLGALALTYGGFRYAYPDDVEIGPISVDVTRHATLFVPPVVGILAIAGGVGLIMVRGKDA